MRAAKKLERTAFFAAHAVHLSKETGNWKIHDYLCSCPPRDDLVGCCILALQRSLASFQACFWRLNREIGHHQLQLVLQNLSILNRDVCCICFSKNIKLNPAAARTQSRNFNDSCELLLFCWKTLLDLTLFKEFSNCSPCWECMFLAFQHNPPPPPSPSYSSSSSSPSYSSSSSQIWVKNIVTNIQIWLAGICRGSETGQFLCCKQYLLTENLSVEGLGRIFWIADILVSSPPILSCPPSLMSSPPHPPPRPLSSKVSGSVRQCPPASHVKSIIVLQLRLRLFPTCLKPPRSTLCNLDSTIFIDQCFSASGHNTTCCTISYLNLTEYLWILY